MQRWAEEWRGIMSPGAGGVVILAAEVGEGGSSQITKGFVSQLEESKLSSLGEWGRAEVFEQEVV